MVGGVSTRFGLVPSSQRYLRKLSGLIPDLFYIMHLHKKLSIVLFIFRQKLPTGPVAHQAAVLGHRFTAAEALDAKIVRTVTSKLQLMQRSKELAKDLVKRAPYGRDILRSMKEDMYQTIGNVAEQNLKAKL